MFPSFLSGKGIFTHYKFSHLTTTFFIRKNKYFSDIRFLQCAGFWKSLRFFLNIVMKPIWVRALKLIFSQVYITRLCLQFYRPPKFSRFFCFWEFRISDFRFASFTGQILAWTEKIWNTIFFKEKNLGILGGLQNCRQGLVILTWLNIWRRALTQIGFKAKRIFWPWVLEKSGIRPFIHAMIHAMMPC